MRPCEPWPLMHRKGWSVMEVPNRCESVAWATTTVCPLASGFSSSTVSDSRTASAAADTESSSSKSAGAKISRNCYRSSTRQSHSARSRDQCPRQCRRGSLEVVAGIFTECHTVCPCSSNWGAIGCVHPISRACQETLRQSRCRIVEASNRARSVGHGVSRRASPFRSAPRGSRSEAPISPSRTEGCGFRVGEDAGSDRPSSGAIPVDWWTSWWSGRRDGSVYSHGFGEDCGHSFGTYGSFNRRSRRQKTSCGGRGLVLWAVQFEKVFSPIRHNWRRRRGGQSPWPIVVSPVASRHQCCGRCAHPSRFRPVQCSG